MILCGSKHVGLISVIVQYLRNNIVHFLVDCCESVSKIYVKIYVNSEIKMKKSKN